MRLCPLAVTTAMLALSLVAYADTFSVTGSTTNLTPSADSLTLVANSGTFTPGSSFVLQTGTYAAGNSGNLSGTFPFSFTENLTIDGQTLAVLFSGKNVVTNPSQANTDYSVVFSGPSTYFSTSGLTITPSGFTSASLYAGQTVGVTLNATTSVTPEPSSLALLGTGILGVIGAVRRRSV